MLGNTGMKKIKLVNKITEDFTLPHLESGCFSVLVEGQPKLYQ